jgi:AcrR family transcriptional regulator
MKKPSPAPSTRDRLIQTAMQLFWEKGYGSTSVADVLHAAGVNSGSLYHFFPGKQDLLLAVLDAYRAGIDPMLLAPAWKGVDDPIERIFALLARYRLGIVQTDCVEACLVAAGPRLPRTLDRRELARFVLTAMEGGVMQARTHRDPAYFDSSVRQLRIHFEHLEHEAAQQPSRARSPRKRSTSRGSK